LKKIYSIFLLLLLSGTSLFSQLSKKHYIPPVTGASNTSGPGSQILYISTPSTSKVNYTVRYGGDIGTTATSGTPFATGQVTNGDPEQVLIANDPADNTVQWSEIFVNPSLTEVVSDKGFVIEADSEIYVSYRFYSVNEYQAGALVSKGISALGTRFRSGMLQNQSASSGHLGFISVMAY
jgi:hypothetical protein